MTQGDIGYWFSILNEGVEKQLSGNDRDIARAISSIVRSVTIDLNRLADALENNTNDCQRRKHD